MSGRHVSLGRNKMSGIEDENKTPLNKVDTTSTSVGDADKPVIVGSDSSSANAPTAGLDAAKGALGAVGGMLAGSDTRMGDNAVDPTLANKGVSSGVADTMSNANSNNNGGAGIAALGTGAAISSSGVANAGNQTYTGAGNNLRDPDVPDSTYVTSGSSDGNLPPLAARLDRSEKSNSGPSIFLPVLGVLALGVAAYVGWYTIANGEGTVFSQREVAPAVAPAAAAAPVVAAAPAMPAWLNAIGDKSKAAFAWLTLGANGNNVIVSGEAADEAAKASALADVTAAVRATPEGANSLIIDNIKVAGTTTAPVGAALAGLGANPNVAACNTAFSTTMNGRTINFSTNGASISGGNASLLDTLTAVATACKLHRIEVGGHTDSVGKPENNLALSQKRADAVKAYWTGKGVAAVGLVATGFGEAKPVEAVADETANEKNRRIEFKVTDPTGVASETAAPPVVPAK